MHSDSETDGLPTSWTVKGDAIAVDRKMQNKKIFVKESSFLSALRKFLDREVGEGGGEFTSGGEGDVREQDAIMGCITGLQCTCVSTALYVCKSQGVQSEEYHRNHYDPLVLLKELLFPLGWYRHSPVVLQQHKRCKSEPP